MRSIRGAGGGYVLARAAGDITVADILAAAGESMRTNRCDDTRNSGCTGKSVKCRAHDLWSALGEHVEMFLGGITLEDVCEGRFTVPGEAREGRVAG